MNPTSVARTVTRTGTQIYAGREKLAIFACEYYFKPQGVVAVTENFKRVLQEKKLNADVADCQWSIEDCFWRISCTGNAEAIYAEFIKVIRGLIKQGGWDDYYSDSDDDDEDEDEDEDEDIDGSVASFDSEYNEIHRSYRNIVRLSIWERCYSKLNRYAIIGDRESTVIAQGPAKGALNSDLSSEFPEEIRSYKERSIWEYKESQSFLNEVLSDAGLMEIAKLCDCQFVNKWNQQRIYIGSYLKANVQRAVRKLNNIKKQAEWRPHYVEFVFYAEELADVRLQFKFFTSIKEGYFRTTLLDNLLRSMANDYSNLNLAATVRCAHFDSLKALYVVKKVPEILPVTSDLDLNIYPFWEKWTYNAKGSGEFLKHLPLLPPHEGKDEAPQTFEAALNSDLEPNEVTKEGVEGWVRGVPPSSSVEFANKVNSQASSIQVPVVSYAPATITEPFFTNPHIVPKVGNWDTVVEYGHHEVTEQKKNMYKTSYTPAGLAAKAKSLLSCKVPPGIPRQRPAPLRPPALSNLQSTHPDSTLQPVAPAALVTAIADSYAVDLSTAQPSSPQGQFSLLDYDINNPVMNQKYNPLQPVTRSVSLPLIQASPTAFVGDRQAENHNLIDFDSDELQVNDEVASREFYNTMRQTAPKIKKNHINGKQNPYSGRLELPSPPRTPPIRSTTSPHLSANLQDPLPEFLTKMNHKFIKMMDGAQGFRGEIRLHVEFGRLIVKNIHEEHIEQNNDPGGMTNLLKSGPLIFFTNMLTVDPADIHYLLNLKNKAMWRGENADATWSTLYEFHCRNTENPGHNPFTIEIDTEGFAVKVKTKQAIGEINVFGTKRHWDFRLIAEGFKDCWETDESYQVLAKAIQSSLFVESKNELPEIYFQLPNAMVGDNKMEIDGIRVHRIREYTSRSNKSILKISEIQELKIGKKPGEVGKGTSVYRANTACYTPGSFWHTVTISSVQANKLLLENETLELGDEASWTSASLAAVDAAPAMYLPAVEMLKRMDGIGYYNDNAIDPSAAAPPKSIQPKAVKFEFW